MRYSVLSIAVIIILVLACSKKKSNEDILKSYLESHNRNDVEAVMENLHENARITMPGRPPITDVRKMEAWDASISSNLEYDSWQVNGDTIVVGKIFERNNWFSKAGIAGVEYEPGTKIIFKDEKILEIRTAEMTRKSQNELANVYQSFILWVQDSRPEELQKLMRNGELVLNEEVAKDWFLLLDQWQRSK